MTGFNQKAYAKDYYLKNKDKIKERHRKNQILLVSSKPELVLWRGAKSRASRFGLEFNIEVTDITIPETCPILMVPLRRKTRYAPSLDRIDPTIGYVKGNIAVISSHANKMKNNSTPQELKDFALWALKTYQV